MDPRMMESWRWISLFFLRSWSRENWNDSMLKCAQLGSFKEKPKMEMEAPSPLISTFPMGSHDAAAPAAGGTTGGTTSADERSDKSREERRLRRFLEADSGALLSARDCCHVLTKSMADSRLSKRVSRIQRARMTSVVNVSAEISSPSGAMSSTATTSASPSSPMRSEMAARMTPECIRKMEEKL